MSTIKILLIDDERIEREGIAYLLQQMAYNVQCFEAKNGLEALKIMQDQNFDIVICDIRMPVMGGLEFLEQATKLYTHPKYIIYSAYSDFEYAKEAINLKVEDYLLKPIQEQEFFGLIDKVLSRIRLDRRENTQNTLDRALRGLNILPGMKNNIDWQCGIVLLLYIEKPLLDSMGGTFSNIINSIFTDAYIFIINEQECYIAILDDMDNLHSRLKDLLYDINTKLDSACQIMISSQFTSYDTLRDSIQESKQIMKRGFFTKDNVIVSASEINEVPKYFGFFDNDDSNALCNDSTDELVNYIMRSFKQAGDYSNIYTKYTLAKEMERIVHHVSPDGIQNLLAASNIAEIRNAIENIVRENPQELSATESAKAYIHSHYSENISIDDIADNVFLNSNYLCTVFKRDTGMTLIAYITEYRMNRAMDLVSNTRMKVNDIAKKVGYRNTSYFNMIFKNFFGNTPTAYRKGSSE